MLVKTVLNTDPSTVSTKENIYSHVVRVTYPDGRLLKDFMVCSVEEANRLKGNLYRLFVTKLATKDLSYKVIDLKEEAKELAKAKELAEAKAKELAKEEAIARAKALETSKELDITNLVSKLMNQIVPVIDERIKLAMPKPEVIAKVVKTRKVRA